MLISAGILAGGKSSRMGTNKALLKVNNERFIDKLIKELSAFDEVLISAANKGDYADCGLPVYEDTIKEYGPLEGMYQLIKNAGNEYVFICAVDMPFVTAELVNYIAEFISSDYDAYVITDEEHIHPLCAIYKKSVIPVLEELIEQDRHRIMDLIGNIRTKYIKLENTCFDKKVVKNINTKDAYIALSLPKIFCVSAVKNSGKTGLIIKLINEFIKEGYKVGVIKHDGHDYIMDHEGTDTMRFSEAGAVMSTIYSDYQYSVNYKGKKDLSHMVELLKDECDIIIIEGAKNSSYPKIEVVRKEISDSICCAMDMLICVATDVVSQDEVKCPVYRLDDIDGIFLCLKKYLEIG